MPQTWWGVIDEYRSFLPVTDATPIVTMWEGGTPLLPARSLSDRVGAKVYLKNEGVNPTGSFKDRGMTLAVSKAAEARAEVIICASTGNTSASAAAYGAAAGIRVAVLIPEGAIAVGKLTQALMHGAHVLEVQGGFDDALKIVRDLGQRQEVAVVNSINPHRIDGQKTAAFEIVDLLGDAPHYHCVPVGNAGNITAYWKGYREYMGARRANRVPRMLGFQAEGSDPLVRGEPVDSPQTVASALRIGEPASWSGAMKAVRESGGSLTSVTDEEILDAYRFLAAHEGLFCEPASAAAVAGLLKLDVPTDSTVVCVLTGHGLKDPDTARDNMPKPVRVRADTDAVRAELSL